MIWPQGDDAALWQCPGSQTLLLVKVVGFCLNTVILLGEATPASKALGSSGSDVIVFDRCMHCHCYAMVSTIH